MKPVKVVCGKWQCEHEDGHSTMLSENERMKKSPYYVVCPDCGTHWITVKPKLVTLAYPVIVSVFV